jgi:hypothetical protein
MEMSFSSFVMSETTRNQIAVLPGDLQLKFFWAVANFGLDGTEPDFAGLELAVWIPMRDFILNAKRKDEAWLRKQSENGRKGGAPKGNQNAKKTTQNNPNNPAEFKTTQTSPNDNDKMIMKNDNVNSFSAKAEENFVSALSDFSDSETKKTPGKESAPPKKGKAPLADREPENDYERVEKRYLENWRTLYKRGKVKSEKPSVNWGQIRSMLKNLFADFRAEQVAAAVDTAMSDDWILSNGYCFGTILSATVFNRLINSGPKIAAPAGSPPQKTALRGFVV